MSNESQWDVNVFFDELTVTHEHIDIVQHDDFFPFGLTFNSSGDRSNKYLYNGKELQDELGLNLYDYGARMYDPAVGRFFTQDRFAEKYLDFSPYQYGANSPVNFIDINGDSLWIQINKNNKALYVDGSLYNADGTAYSGKGVKKDGTLKGYLKNTVNALDKIRSGTEGESLVSQIQSSDKSVKISKGDNGYNPENNNYRDAQNGTGVNGLVSWSNSDYDAAGNKRPSFIGLAHELAHGLDGSTGKMDGGIWFYIPLQNGAQDPVFKPEIFATHWENKIRMENGLSLRTHYMQSIENSRVIRRGSTYVSISGFDYKWNALFNKMGLWDIK